MRKTTLLFQLLTEGSLLGIFALCMSPSTFSFKLNFLGQTLSLDLSGIASLPTSTTTALMVATMVILFITILFSMTIKDESKHIRYYRDYIREIERRHKIRF